MPSSMAMSATWYVRQSAKALMYPPSPLCASAFSCPQQCRALQGILFLVSSAAGYVSWQVMHVSMLALRWESCGEMSSMD